MPQTLILEVAGRHAAQFGSRARKSFEGKGGSIGRSEDCDWVLSASGVSRVHAMIRLLNGMYFIEDRSTNGMLLNGAPLVKGDPSALRDGDRILIDSFEVECRLADAVESMLQSDFQAAPAPVHVAPAPVAAAAPVADPFDFAMFDVPAAPVQSAPPTRMPPSELGRGNGDLIPGFDGGSGAAADDLDPLSFLGPLDGAGSHLSPGKPDTGIGQDWNHSAGTADHFRPPRTAMSLGDEHRQTSTLPENWDLTMGDFAPKPVAPPAPPPPRPPPPPAAPAMAPQQAPVASSPGAVAVASRPTSTDAVPAEVDRILRVVIDGVMDVLRARAEIKNTFRLPVTIIQRSENNPLKFAPTAEEAMQKILSAPNPAFLSGTAAFEDAFDDIRCHQMAMLAGVRAAFESLLAHFNPERYEQEADGGAKRGGFMDFAAGKGKYWEKYRENFDGLTKNPDEAFRRLFGDEFARAYEEQLSRLKSARRMQQPLYR